MHAWAKKFYSSSEWKQTREAYRKSVGYVCERCRSMYPNNPEMWNTGEIVHHIKHITKDNITDPSITLSFDNLECVCRDCHAAEHPEIYSAKRNKNRFSVDANGNVVEMCDHIPPSMRKK
jgi:5-methylcytosine-specific restriction endonuclease McrA